MAFGISLNKDVVRRILAVRYRPVPDSAGPSWLTVLGHAKDSLWSLDLFRCESAILRTHWVRNLRVLDVQEIKTVPYVPLSHPFVERLIGTIRREYLDRTLFWTTADLEMTLLDFQRYYNGYRAHAGLDGRTPEPRSDLAASRTTVSSYRWQRHCRGLYQTPMAA